MDKRKIFVMKDENRLSGLKKHSKELNRIVVESLKEALIDLMGKFPFDKISITALCKRAGVSRMAFYGNFSSKEDVIDSIVIDLCKELVKVSGTPVRNNTTLKWYEIFFAFIKEKSSVLKPIFKAGFENRYLMHLNGMVLSDENAPTKKKYQRLIWTGGIEKAVSYWLETGMKESIFDIAKYCDENLSPWNY